jgi:glycosyltransferase involved in cell wall biosynthesis
MKTPFLSIIIPALNEEKFIPKLLTDIKKQKYKNFEVIVIDGDSDDKTRQVAESYAEYYTITVVNAKRRNLSFQRNLGGEIAKGEYLVFIDADSRIRPSFTYNLHNEIHKSKYLILLPTIVPDKGSQTDKVWFALINFLTEMSQSVGKPAPSIGCMVFQKGFFDFLGGYQVNNNQDKKTFFPEDHDIILRARKSGVIGKCMKSVKVGF